jgi:Fic family protein
MPGEFRTTQNWVGAGGSTIETARFVPPSPEELSGLLSDWERYAHEDPEAPLLASRAVEENLGVTRPTALKLLRQLEKVGVLEEGNTVPRGQRRYLARELMDAVTDDTESQAPGQASHTSRPPRTSPPVGE